MATVVHLFIVLTQERGKTMGIVCMYMNLVEILLELTLGPISTNSQE